MLACVPAEVAKNVDFEDLKSDLQGKLPAGQSLGRMNNDELDVFVKTDAFKQDLSAKGLSLSFFEQSPVSTRDSLVNLDPGMYSVFWRQTDGDETHWVAMKIERGQQTIYETAPGW